MKQDTLKYVIELGPNVALALMREQLVQAGTLARYERMHRRDKRELLRVFTNRLKITGAI